MCGFGLSADRTSGWGCRTKFGAAIGHSAAGNRHAAAEYRDAASQHGNSASRQPSGHGNTAESATGNVPECDTAGQRARVEFTEHANAGKQHATFDRKSEYAKHAGHDPERYALRTAAGNGGNAECVDAAAGVGDARSIESKFVKSKFAKSKFV